MREKLEELTSRSPRALGFNRSRWTLEMLRTRLGEKAPETDSGTWHMLDRLGISHTQGQGYVLSPDEHFEAKRAFIDGVRMRTGTEGEPESETPQPSEAQSSEEPESPLRSPKTVQRRMTLRTTSKKTPKRTPKRTPRQKVLRQTAFFTSTS